MNQWPLEQYQDDPEFFMYLTMGQFRAELARLMEEMPEMTQRKLSELLKLSEPRISNILHSSPNITIKTMCELAGAFGKMVEIKLVDRVSLGQPNVCSEPQVIFSPVDDEYDELHSTVGMWKSANLGSAYESYEGFEIVKCEADGGNGQEERLAA